MSDPIPEPKPSPDRDAELIAAIKEINNTLHWIGTEISLIKDIQKEASKIAEQTNTIFIAIEKRIDEIS